MASLRTALGISLVAAAATGCADQGGQILIIMNNAVPGADCTIDPSGAGEAFRGAGKVDAQGALADATSVGYLLTPTLKNIGDSEGGRFENERTVLTDGARVDVQPSNGSNGMPILSDAEIAAIGDINFHYSILFSAPVSPDGGLTGVGFDVLPLPVLDAIGAKLTEPGQEALVIIQATVFGETIGGIGVETDPFSYPITVCNGCLTFSLGSCVGLPAGTYAPGGECNLFQDLPAECCTRTSGLTVCPAVPE